LLENDREIQINFKNKAWTEAASLRLQLSEHQKVPSLFTLLILSRFIDQSTKS